MKKRKLFLTGLTLACGALFAGCGNNDLGSDDRVTIEFFSQKVEMNEVLQDIVSDFEDQNPDVSVNFTSVNNGGVVLRTRMAGNEAPDVIHIFPQNADFKEWAADGRFVDLTEESFMDNIKEGAAEMYAVNGGLYSLPLNTNAYGIYFNQTAFAELGLEVPGTWDEFMQLVDQINETDYAAFAAALSTPEAWTLNGFHQLAWGVAAGGFDGAQDALVGSGIDGINKNDPTLQMVSEMLSLITDNTQRNAIGASYSDSVAAFASGNALMLPQGTWALPVINDQNPDFEVGMFPFPGLNEGEAITIGAADLALSVSADVSEERQEAAKRFLAFMTEAEVMQRYFDVDGSPTSVLGVETEGRFTETANVTDLAFTERQLIWLHSEWPSEEEFWTLTVEYIINQNTEDFVSDLNRFFNQMN